MVYTWYIPTIYLVGVPDAGYPVTDIGTHDIVPDIHPDIRYEVHDIGDRMTRYRVCTRYDIGTRYRVTCQCSETCPDIRVGSNEKPDIGTHDPISCHYIWKVALS